MFNFVYIYVGDHISSYFDHKLKIYFTFLVHFIIHLFLKQNRTIGK